MLLIGPANRERNTLAAEFAQCDALDYVAIRRCLASCVEPYHELRCKRISGDGRECFLVPEVRAGKERSEANVPIHIADHECLSHHCSKDKDGKTCSNAANREQAERCFTDPRLPNADAAPKRRDAKLLLMFRRNILAIPCCSQPSSSPSCGCSCFLSSNLSCCEN
jgi:hypothetical protein